MAGWTRHRRTASSRDELPPPTTVEVADGVYAYVQPDGSWWINNTGFVVGRDEVLSIDTCSTERRTRGLPRRDRRGHRSAGADDREHPPPRRSHERQLPGRRAPRSSGHEGCRAEVLATPIGSADAAFQPIEWGELSVAPPTVTFEDRLDIYVDERKVELHHVGRTGPHH